MLEIRSHMVNICEKATEKLWEKIRNTVHTTKANQHFKKKKHLSDWQHDSEDKTKLWTMTDYKLPISG